MGESVAQPLRYFAAKVQGAISLLQAMQLGTVRTLVFSSSATVYGNPQYLPFDEAHPTGAKNPYGRTKLHIEHMLQDLAASDPNWQIACLRYFNPVGAHPSGLIGEAPHGIPNNLMPYVAQVATGQRPHLNVFGNDYPTLDGTGVRDYIHVMDLAEGHLAALNFLSRHSPPPPSFPATTGDPPCPPTTTPSTWAPVPAPACCNCWKPLRPPAVKPSPTKSAPAAPATWQPIAPMHNWLKKCLVGRPDAACMTCAPALGIGKTRAQPRERIPCRRFTRQFGAGAPVHRLVESDQRSDLAQSELRAYATN